MQEPPTAGGGLVARRKATSARRLTFSMQGKRYDPFVEVAKVNVELPEAMPEPEAGAFSK